MYVAAATVGGALFPRLAHRLRWPQRLRGRRLALYVAWNAAVVYAIRYVVAPHVRRQTAEYERVHVALRDELGREPTPDEVLARFVAEQ